MPVAESSTLPRFPESAAYCGIWARDDAVPWSIHQLMRKFSVYEFCLTSGGGLVLFFAF